MIFNCNLFDLLFLPDWFPFLSNSIYLIEKNPKKQTSWINIRIIHGVWLKGFFNGIYSIIISKHVLCWNLYFISFHVLNQNCITSKMCIRTFQKDPRSVSTMLYKFKVMSVKKVFRTSRVVVGLFERFALNGKSPHKLKNLIISHVYLVLRVIFMNMWKRVSSQKIMQNTFSSKQPKMTGW